MDDFGKKWPKIAILGFFLGGIALDGLETAQNSRVKLKTTTPDRMACPFFDPIRRRRDIGSRSENGRFWYCKTGATKNRLKCFNGVFVGVEYDSDAQTVEIRRR